MLQKGEHSPLQVMNNESWKQGEQSTLQTMKHESWKKGEHSAHVRTFTRRGPKLWKIKNFMPAFLEIEASSSHEAKFKTNFKTFSS